MPSPKDVQLMSAMTTHVDSLLKEFTDSQAWDTLTDKHKGPKHPYVRFVNREAERLVKAIRAAVKEEVRALPGRAQKGAVDAAVAAVAGKVKKALKA